MTRSFSSPGAFRQAVEQRLKNLAETRGIPLNTLRLKLMIERLLARLFARPDPPWLLKGGYAMELRYRPNARTTKDIDLSMSTADDDSDAESMLHQIRDALQAAAEADLGDYLVFRIAAASTQLQGAPQGGARFPVEALMAGRVFGSFHIDIGIGDAIHGTPERLRGEDLLAFADVPPAEAVAIPRAQQFAEKVHAYTYPWSDRINTRSKDFVDLLLILERDAPDTQAIDAALVDTFTTRRTHPIPAQLPEPPQEWASEFASMAVEVHLAAATLDVAFDVLAEYWHTSDLGRLGK